MHPKGTQALYLGQYFQIFHGQVDDPNETDPDKLKALKEPVVRDYGRRNNRSAKTDRGRKGIQWQWQQGDWNICVATGQGGDIIVLDFDAKPGQHGLETLAMLERDYGLPESYRVRTPSGGQHVYLRLPPNIYVSNSASKIGPNLDVRGNASQAFVLAEGSTIGGKPYARLAGSPQHIADCPPRLLELLEGHERAEAEALRKSKIPACELDLPFTVKKAIEWLKEDAPTAVQGDGGDTTTWGVAAVLSDMGVSEAMAFDLMAEHWNTHPDEGGRADPPWPLEYLEVKVRNAYTYAHNQPGERAPADPLDEFGPVDINDNGRRIVATPASFRPTDAIPRRRWIVGGFALRGKVGAIVSPGGIGKTSILIRAALAAATGRTDILGLPVHEQCPVWYWNQEDDIDELDLRVAAAMKDAELTPNQVPAGAFYLSSGVELPTPLSLARRKKDGSLRATTDVRDIIAEITEKNIGLFIIDPLQEIHDAKENDNTEMRYVYGLGRRIAVETGCAVLIAAHTRKPSEASSTGHAGEADSLRGASSQTGVARIITTLVNMSQKDAIRYGVPDHERHLYVRLDLAKSNMSLKGGDPNWFKRIGVQLNSDDPETVGTLSPVLLSEATASDKTNIIEETARAIRALDLQGQWVQFHQFLPALHEDLQNALVEQKNRARILTRLLSEKGVHLPDTKDTEKRKTRQGELTIMKGKGTKGFLFFLEGIPISLPHSTPHAVACVAGEEDQVSEIVDFLN